MSTHDRLHALDAVRAFALLLGVVFHAGFSFIPGLIPGLWAIDRQLAERGARLLLFAAHIFRMSLFFFVAGFFARMLFQRGGRARLLGEPAQANPGAAGRRLARFCFRDRGGVDLGTDEDLRARCRGAANMPPPPPGAFPLTHLWFLYYLLVLYAVGPDAAQRRRRARSCRARSGDVDARCAARAHRRRRAGARAAGGRGAVFPARLDRVVRHSDARSVADSRARLLVGYGTAFAFGWLVHRQPDLLAVWAATVAAASRRRAGGDGGLPLDGRRDAGARAGATGGTKLGFALAYGVALWSWSLRRPGLAPGSCRTRTRRPLRRGLVVLAVSRPSAGRRGVPDGGGELPCTGA